MSQSVFFPKIRVHVPYGVDQDHLLEPVEELEHARFGYSLQRGIVDILQPKFDSTPGKPLEIVDYDYRGGKFKISNLFISNMTVRKYRRSKSEVSTHR